MRMCGTSLKRLGESLQSAILTTLCLMLLVPSLCATWRIILKIIMTCWEAADYRTLPLIRDRHLGIVFAAFFAFFMLRAYHLNPLFFLRKESKEQEQPAQAEENVPVAAPAGTE